MDLLALRALGALLFQTDNGELWALFDDEGAQIDVDGVRVNSTAPQLTARSIDVERCQVGTRGARVSRQDEHFTVREPIPDGTGLTTLILDKDR